MHVLVAATRGLETAIDAGLRWACDNGASLVERTASQDATIALASSGGPAAHVYRRGSVTVMSLGLGRVTDYDDLLAGRAPKGTIAIAVSSGSALVVVGEGNQRLFAFRDGRGAIVSSHLGALAAAIGDVDIDRSYEDFLLGFGFLPDGMTLFRGVRMLPQPSVSELRTGVLTPLAGKEPESFGVDVDLADVVCEIVDEQAGSAKSVGVLLGGFDSALVASALNRTGREVHTFTFKFRERGFGQKNVDPAVAASNAHHHWVEITPDVLGTALLNLPARLNQPSPQPHYQLMTILAAEAARGVGVQAIFTGDGCDSLFAAYPTVNTRAATVNSLQRVPSPIRRAALSALSSNFIDDSLGHVARVGRSALRSSLLDAPTKFHLPTQYLDQVSLRRLRVGVAPDQMEEISMIRERLAVASGRTSPARLAVDGNALVGQSSSKVEGIVNRTGLPVASPFTHPRFSAALAALPETLRQPDGKLRGREGKPILQDAASRSGLLPDAVIYQKKQAPTQAPVDLWFAGPLRSTVLDLIAGLPFEVDQAYLNGILKPKYAEDWYREKVALSGHVFQVVGLLASYGSFARLAR